MKNKLIIPIGSVLVIIVIVALYFSFSQEVVGDTYIPQYPSATDKVFTERFGSLDCKLTGADTGAEEGSFVKCVKEVCGGNFDTSVFNLFEYSNEGAQVYYRYIDCPANIGSGLCKVNIPSRYTICKSSSSTNQIKIGSGNWQSIIGDEYTQTTGVNQIYKIRCKTPAENGVLTYNPLYFLKVPERAIYVNDPTGMTRSGRLSGTSPNCNLISADAQTLKKMQEAGKTVLEGVTSIPLGQTLSIVVGWAEEPAFGNINPMGQYNSQDVVCKPFNGIYSVEKILTIGGIGYWKQKNFLVNLNSDRTKCCNQESCGSGQVCENYQCTSKAVTCPEGTCNYWQKGTTLIKDKEVEISGKFYLRTQTCDSNACIHTEDKEVKCTKDYCDRFDTPSQDYYCSPDFSGCITVKTKQQCPNGQCCTEKNPNYFVQNCPSQQKCCIGLGNDNDPDRGECANDCLGIEVEVCSDKADNDKDGLIDGNDPDCQVCIIEGVEKSGFTPTQCCQEQGGKWIEKSKKSGGILTLLFGIGGETTKTQYCQKGFMFNTEVILSIVVGLLAGLVVFLLLAKFFKLQDTAVIWIISIISVLVAVLVGALLIFYFEIIRMWVIIAVIILFITWVTLKIVMR